MRISVLRPALLALISAQLVLLPVVAQKSPAASQRNRVADHADLGARVGMKQALPNWAVAEREAGALPADRTLGVTLTLARSPEVQTAFEQLLDDQQNPNSARYHQWLTPQQVGDEYGPTEHDLGALTAWLEGQGLTVTGVSPSRTFVEATGSAGVVGKAFGTSFKMYRTLGKVQYSAAAQPSVPAAFAGMIQAVSGLNEIHHVAMNHVRQPEAADAANPLLSTTSGSHYLLPGDFATIFNLTPVYAANIKGAGQKVAIIGRSQVTLSDITSFETVAGIPTNTPNIIVVPTGTDPGIQSGDEGESDLDLQRVIGTAPAVTADFVISGTNTTTQEDGINTAMQYEINTLLDPVMTISYGLCEASAGASGVTFINSLFSQAAAEGISVFVSSGDSGAAACDDSFASAPSVQQLGINYICSSQYSTCVGGTEFNDTATPATYWGSANDPTTRASALGYIPEGAWNESAVGNVAASGGGASSSVAKPTFQAGPGVPADTFRDVPDVSFPAASHVGYIGCEADVQFSDGGTGACTVTNGVFSGGVIFSGTSAAAPSWAGVAALLNQKLGKAQGNLNPLVYRLGALTSGSPFHDVTPTTAGVSPCDLTTPSLCNNTTPGASSLTNGLEGYAVTTGYDLVTGWGSADISALLTAAAAQPALTATTTTIAAAPSVNVTSKQSVVFTSSVTSASGTPTGTIQFSASGTPLGAPVTLTNGKAVSAGSTFTIGNYSVTAVYSGSSTFASSSSAPAELSVAAAGTAAATLTLAPTATTALTSTAVGFTVTAKGAGAVPTGTVTLKLNGNAYGSVLTLSGGTATIAPGLLPAGTDAFVATYSGDDTYAATTAAATVVVTAIASTTTIAPLTATTEVNGYVVLTANVAAAAGASGTVPTGTVTLYAAGTTPQVVGSLQLDATGVVGANLDFTGAPVGSYSYYWVYAGDGVYGGSQSATATYTVSSSFQPTVVLTPVTATVAVTAGSNITNTVDVASSNGFTGTVAVTCSATFNGTSSVTVVLPVCTASSVALSSTNSDLISTVTLSTTAVHAAAGVSHVSRNQPSLLSPLRSFRGMAIAGLVLFCFPTVRRRKNWSALASVLVLVAMAGLAGCGGSSSTPAPPTTPTSTGTPAGAYTVTVKGAGATTTFTLTVQ